MVLLSRALNTAWLSEMMRMFCCLTSLAVIALAASMIPTHSAYKIVLCGPRDATILMFRSSENTPEPVPSVVFEPSVYMCSSLWLLPVYSDSCILYFLSKTNVIGILSFSASIIGSSSLTFCSIVECGVIAQCHKLSVLRRTAVAAAACCTTSCNGGRFSSTSRAAVGVVLMQPVVAMQANLCRCCSLFIPVVRFVRGHHTTAP